jgi:hypothetical protein
MLSWVLRFFGRALGLLASSATVWGAVSCTHQPGGDLCPSITGHAEGVQVTDCPHGTITLSGARFDSSGNRSSYSFLVICQGRSAHGVWSNTGGLKCVEGAYPCDGGTCTPTSDLDCEILTNCVTLGECGFSDGKCVLTDDGCARSEIPCGLSGACHLVNGACAATSDTDCQSPFGSCVDCSFAGACATSGNCHVKDGACIATNGTECKASSQCAFAGKCSLAGDACIAATDADCTSSEVCRTAGQCSAVMGVCAVK